MQFKTYTFAPNTLIDEFWKKISLSNMKNLDPEDFSVLDARLAVAEVKPSVNISGRSPSSRQPRILLDAWRRFLKIEQSFLGLRHMSMGRDRSFTSQGQRPRSPAHLTCWGTKRKEPLCRQHPWSSHGILISDNWIHTTKHVVQREPFYIQWIIMNKK